MSHTSASRNRTNDFIDGRRGARERTVFVTFCLGAWCLLAIGAGAALRDGYLTSAAIQRASQENFVAAPRGVHMAEAR